MSSQEQSKSFLSTFLGEGIHSKLPILFLTMLLLAVPAFAIVDPVVVTISPEQARCGEGEIEYTVNVENVSQGTDSIREVRIYDDVDGDNQTDDGIVSFSCGTPPTGWTLDDRLALYHYCQYETQRVKPGDMIEPGEDLNFAFSAQLDDASLSECGNTFKVSTIDDQIPEGNTYFKFPRIHVDCEAPIVLKDVGTPKILMSAPDCDTGPFQGEGEDSCDYWITQSTVIDIDAYDNNTTDGETLRPQNEQCDLGIESCKWRYRVDGGAWSQWSEHTNGGHIEFPISFGEDSEHEIEIECVDVVGNKTTVTETDKVDDTPPSTEKVISDPKKVIDGDDPEEKIEWVDTTTTITLTAEDNGPICAIGVDKTWYMNKIDETEESCWDPYNYCNPLEFPTPHTPNGIGCINAGQDFCDEYWDTSTNGGPYPTWEACVEDFAHYECGVDPLWHLYDGTPIQKDEESCHVLQFFSVDHIGNIEDMQVNCFFVDKTPPEVDKDNGQAIPDSGEPAFMIGKNTNGDFHWITQDMPIEFTCTDQDPHPSEGEKLCFKVSYDEDPDGYNTDEYCTLYGGKMGFEDYCCISATPSAPFEFKFKEDSMHDLEYYCKDAVDKNSSVHTQYYKVDTRAPTVDKTLNAPYYGTECPPQPDDMDADCFVDSATTIDLTVLDEGICAVDEVECKWRYRVAMNMCVLKPVPKCTEKWMDNWSDWNSSFPIMFPEESHHELEIECSDALGNTWEDTEYFYVDKTPPVTTKEYGDPFYEDDGGEWILPTTEVTLTVDDAGPHKSGIDRTEYRVSGALGDQFCTPQGCDAWMQSLRPQMPAWQTYTGAFTIGEESCHVIEFRSVDNVGKEEEIKWQCVYVDDTAPEMGKVIGEPHVAKDEKDYITQDTPITLSCSDTGPHPVDHVSLWYRYRTSDDCADLSSAVFGDWITAPSTVKASSSSMRFSSTGWGGWSCPAGTIVVGGGYEPEPADHPVAHSLAWEPGACVGLVCWPNTPFGYTYSEGETGWIVQNGGEAQDLTVYAICAAPFTFTEDSCHELEYYCEDILGNTTEVLTEIDIVDTQGPIIEKTVVGPQVECPVRGGQPELCDGWGCLEGLEKDFFTTGRYGNQVTPAQTWELAIWEVDGSEVVVDQDDYIWNNGGTVSFSVSYDPSDGSVVYTVGNTTLTHTYDTGKAFEYIIPFAKGNSSGNATELTNMTLNGNAIPDVISGTGYKGLRVPLSDADQVNGFTLTGTAQLTWGGSPANELPAFHVFAMNTHSPMDCFLIDGVTEIHVDAYDPEPHPVDEVTCEWGYDWQGQFYGWYTPAQLPFVIQDLEESQHILTIKCEDGLGNVTEDVERFLVDKTSPVTTKTYGDPHFPSRINDGAPYPHWISSATPITLAVEDAGPHKSGIKETKYRVTLLGEDKYCEAVVECEDNAVGTDVLGGWKTYTESFEIGQESCHLIEYYSVDNVDKTEITKKQCVFVDNKAPEPDKTVGEPKDVWTPGHNGDPESYFYGWIEDYCRFDPEVENSCLAGEDCIDCWEATVLTPLDMDCVDPEPHPVDNETVCFNVELDGEDETSQYCPRYGGNLEWSEENQRDFCCLERELENFYFMEDSEHNLKYYCVDALGNSNEEDLDEEKFKIEGTKFEIPLFKKWNLISVPFGLLNDSPEEVFKDTEGVDRVWTYDPSNDLCPEEWCVFSDDEVSGNDSLNSISPGWGYWVLELLDEEWLTIGGSLFNTGPVAPPSRELLKGWNLIGYYGSSWEIYDWSDFSFTCGDAFDFPDRFLYGDKVYCALNSLVDTQEGYPRWSSLWSYINCGNHHAAWLGLNACADRSVQQLLDRMYAGRGYWVEMDVEDLYAPATTCIWNDDFECRWTGGGIIP